MKAVKLTTGLCDGQLKEELTLTYHTAPRGHADRHQAGPVTDCFEFTII